MATADKEARGKLLGVWSILRGDWSLKVLNTILLEKKIKKISTSPLVHSTIMMTTVPGVAQQNITFLTKYVSLSNILTHMKYQSIQV